MNHSQTEPNPRKPRRKPSAGPIIQSLDALEAFYATPDPWGYRENPEDLKRRALILSSIPKRDYRRALDIGCGEGFLTHRLPAREITGADVSRNCIARARKLEENQGCEFVEASLFDLPEKAPGTFDLILITGVVYPQYFASSLVRVYQTVDRLLEADGILVTCHIDEWYRARFPYLMLDFSLFGYREFQQRLEIYVK